MNGIDFYPETALTSVTKKQSQSHWYIVPAVATWLLPGLGHYLLGQKARGVILVVSILGLWLGGLIIGGISVIDREQHTAWFIGQSLIGPSILVNSYHQSLRHRQVGGPQPDDNALYEPSYGRMHEQGTLYTALAGMLNLLAIMDVIYRDPNDPRYSRQQEQLAAAKA